ncbi:TonB-dependent receptor [Acidipila sp. EB88]|uniref:TonB-dependent receptor n=1 Tax=Acidipila sp. EB88 TaxID=2305226 RepID=UPI001F2F23C1|nr:TonB-dependent receptor [Acidipila sp. EB88]
MAQTITGTVNGIVTDASGAVMPDTTIVVKNTATNVETTAKTNNAGEYSVRFLQIGQYTVTVTGAGFKTYTSQPFTLEVNQIAKVDAKMETGAATENVNVSGNVQPILDTEDTTLQTTFTANTIQNLPLNGRNFSSITMFLPGAVSTSPADMSGSSGIERDTGQNGTTSVNGNRNQSNNYLLDGVEINETINNVIGYNPSPDAIENLTVITSNAPAEYGNVNGGDVLAILKSGTNHLHGSVFGFLENYNLDANSWANNFSGNPKQPFTQSIFGGTVGGPIIKDKLFFFADYEGARNQTGGTSVDSVIPQAYRNGDFSSLLTTTNGVTSGQITHYVAGQGLVPYLNNQVPITNPVAQFLFAHPELYPLPNKAAIDGVAQDNYIGAYKLTRRNDQGDVKVDWKLGQNDSFNVRYSQGEASDQNPENGLAITFPTENSFPFKGLAFNQVHTFSSSIINEFRAGWSRVRWVGGVPVDTTGAFGLTGNSLVGINYPDQPYPGFALQDFSNAKGSVGNLSYLTGVGTTGGGSSLINNIFTYGDNLTFQLSKHTLRVGVEILRYQQNNFYPGNDGIMGREQYAGAFTGNNVADFLSDQVFYAGISANSGRSGQRQYRDAGFVQDDWKVSDKLTVNLGLRYEYDQPIYEVNDKEANVDLATAQYYYAGTAAAAAVFGDGHALYHPTYTNFMPRFGFAYQASPRFVVRGGYGITNYLEGTGANLRLNFNPPFQPAYEYTANAATSTSPGDPLPAQTALPESFASSSSSNTLRAWDSHLRPALIQEFTLGTEYELDNKTSVSVAYVGQTGAHLVDPRAGNQLTAPGTVAPYANLVGQTGAIVVTETDAMMNYNALQATVRHRQSNGLEYQLNYTYSKAMTNNVGFYGTAVTGQGNGYGAYAQNGYDLHSEYGPAGNDTPHNISATGVYELPFGRGRRYGANMNRIVDEAAGGWKLTGTAILYAGFPVTLGAPDETSVQNRASRPDQYRKLNVRGRSTNNWFGTDPSAAPCLTSGVDNGTCAYGTPATEQFGTASNGSQRSPGYRQIDLTAGKAFHITESQNFEFRADFFNAFNLASYGYPDTNIGDKNFGQIIDTRSPARQVQFSAHYNF